MLILLIFIDLYLQIFLSSNRFSKTHTQSFFALYILNVKIRNSGHVLPMSVCWQASCFITAQRMNKDRGSPGAWHPSTEAPAVFDPITQLFGLEQAGTCRSCLSISLQIFPESIFSSCFFYNSQTATRLWMQETWQCQLREDNSPSLAMLCRKLHLPLWNATSQRCTQQQQKVHGW